MIFKDDLERVYALLEDEKRWTQGHYAVDASGLPTPIGSPNACARCLEGAALFCDDIGLGDFGDALGLRSVVSFNDAPGRTHAEVLQLLRDAIERAPVRP